METLMKKIAKFLLQKYALGYLVKAWSAVKGYKTQIFTALSVLVYGLQLAGQIPPDLATQLLTVFGSGAGFAFIQKLQRYETDIKEIVDDVRGRS